MFHRGNSATTTLQPWEPRDLHCATVRTSYLVLGPFSTSMGTLLPPPCYVYPAAVGIVPPIPLLPPWHCATTYYLFYWGHPLEFFVVIGTWIGCEPWFNILWDSIVWMWTKCGPWFNILWDSIFVFFQLSIKRPCFSRFYVMICKKIQF